MSDYERIGSGLGWAFKVMFAGLALVLPLAAWKFIEILVWCWQHVGVRVQP